MPFPNRSSLAICIFLSCAMIDPLPAKAQHRDPIPAARLGAALLSSLAIRAPLAFRAQSATPEVQATSSSSPSAKFLAATTVQPDTQANAKNVFRYSISFPAKATAALTMTLQPNQHYKPTPQESKTSGPGARIYGFQSATDSQANSATLTFFVPYSSLPPDVVQQLRAMATGPAALRRSTAPARLLPAMFHPGPGDAPPQMGAQESGSGTLGPPAYQESSGAGEEGVSFSEVLSTADTSIQALLAWMEQEGISDPSLENLGEGVGDASEVFEAVALGEANASLLSQLDAWTYCADNPSVQNPIPLAGATPQLYQGRANQISNSIKTDVAVEFVTIMDKVIASAGATPAANVVLNLLDPLAAITKKLQNLDAQDLDTIRQMLKPYCSGTWYGNYHITGTAPMGISDDDTGNIHFSVSNGQANGTIVGNFKWVETYPQLMNCTGQAAYTGQLRGGVSVMQNFSATTLFASKLSPSTFTLDGMYLDKPCSVAYPSPQIKRQTMYVVLKDGQSSDYDLGSLPGAATVMAPLIQEGFSGHVTVTVRQLK